jgi:outer membrane protein
MQVNTTGRLPVLFSVLLAATVLLSHASPAQAEFKVGFVNVAKVLDQAPQAEAARTRIEKEFSPRDRELLGQQKELRKLEDKLVRDSAVMAESERVKLDNEIRTIKRELRRAQEEFREDLNLKRNQELGKLQRVVIEVIQGLAKQEKYDLVVSDGVIFAGDRVDITDKVLARLQALQKESGKADNGKKAGTPRN